MNSGNVGIFQKRGIGKQRNAAFTFLQETAVCAVHMGRMKNSITQCFLRRTMGMFLCLTASLTHAAVLTVNATKDSGPGSLRQTLQSAANGDTITFNVAGVITLTSGEL